MRVRSGAGFGFGNDAVRASTLCGPGTPLERCIEGKQLVVVSYDAWNHLIRYARPLLDALPSFVIVKPRQDAR